MSHRRYYHDSQNKKYKIKIKRILPYEYKYYQNWHKWVKFPLSKRLSLVFTPDYLLLKRYNKKLIEIPYDDITNWGDHRCRYWNFSWELSPNTKIYKNEKRIKNYFNFYKSCIIYLYPRIRVPKMELNNTMNYYKTSGIHGKINKLRIRQHFTV